MKTHIVGVSTSHGNTRRVADRIVRLIGGINIAAPQTTP